MSRYEYESVGCTPASESCAQVGDDDYGVRARKECEVYRRQLVREHGPPPEGCSLVLRSSAHDLGSYMEVYVRFPADCEAGWDYADRCVCGSDVWDTEARKELGL